MKKNNRNEVILEGYEKKLFIEQLIPQLAGAIARNILLRPIEKEIARDLEYNKLKTLKNLGVDDLPSKEFLDKVDKGKEKVSDLKKELEPKQVDKEIKKIEKQVDKKKVVRYDSNFSIQDSSFYDSLLKEIGADDDDFYDDNILFLYAWNNTYNTGAKFNPFSSTLKYNDSKCQKTIKGEKNCIQNYDSLVDGVEATAKLLKNNYKEVVNAMKNGENPVNIAKKLESANQEMIGNEEELDDKLVNAVRDLKKSKKLPKPKSISK